VNANHVFSGIPVGDYAAARPWYDRFFGRPPDLLPNDNEAAWQLTDSAWVYIVGDVERAGTGIVTILVEDLDAWADEIDDAIPGMRTALRVDPDGNQIQLGQPLA
jgi:catechol 2,3-dioxygenase-like lactoylglutathione lyase family enzyme